ncbi:MAG: hypothetical protein QY309_04805 [Cyclobacteriaceae bacterium]|nr:MAG: hypothetical protein QY309_04805 [Cyclobacteriaceae bacterium]
MNAFALSGFSGLGCDCQQLGSVLAYDQIKIGGKTYSVNQIIGKTITASVDTKLYSGPRGTPSVVGTVKAGQPIGIVYSYLRPEQADGRSWLMFESSYTPGTAPKVYYVPNEAASGSGLKDQGAITVAQEVKKEQEEEARRTDPVGYYLKKYGLPVLLIGGGIYLAATYGKSFIQGKLSQAA